MAQPRRARRLRAKREKRAIALGAGVVCVMIVTAVLPLSPSKCGGRSTNNLKYCTGQNARTDRNVARGERIGSVPFTLKTFSALELPESYLSDPAIYSDFLAIELLPAGRPIPLKAIADNRIDTNAVVVRIPRGYARNYCPSGRRVRR